MNLMQKIQLVFSQKIEFENQELALLVALFENVAHQVPMKAIKLKIFLLHRTFFLKKRSVSRILDDTNPPVEVK